MAKLNLKATGQGDSTYSAFTGSYRKSNMVEDRRDGRGEFRARSDMQGKVGITGNTNANDFYQRSSDTTQRTKTRVNSMTPGSRESENTPDDYSGGAAYGGVSSDSTPDRRVSQARKMSPEDAIDITSNRR